MPTCGSALMFTVIACIAKILVNINVLSQCSISTHLQLVMYIPS